jgi:MFS family permease
MSASAVPSIERHAEYDKSRIFLVSVMSLVTAGICAALRGLITPELKAAFFDPIDLANSATLVSQSLSVAFLGFAITIAVGSPLLDALGMHRLLPLSSLCAIAGTLEMIFAGKISHGPGVAWVIWSSALLMGIGWGLTETVINPLTATLYPDHKTQRLNSLHAWWPGGLIMGSLGGLALGAMHLNWQYQIGLTLIPAIVTLALLIGVKFPPTERAAAGIPFAAMFRELMRPLFIIFWLAMFLTAASELAPGQWVEFALTKTVGMHGILLLSYVSALMFVMRHFAGTLVHKLSPVGLLWISSLLAAAGLALLSIANSPVTGLLAATVWGTGVCYMWPTMLATASERFPRGGALLIGLMGTAGTLSSFFVLPLLGRVYDATKLRVAGGDAAFRALSGTALADVQNIAARTSFRAVAICPAVLLIVFGAIWLYDRSRGGYRAEKL